MHLLGVMGRNQLLNLLHEGSTQRAGEKSRSRMKGRLVVVREYVLPGVRNNGSRSPARIAHCGEIPSAYSTTFLTVASSAVKMLYPQRLQHDIDHTP